jgi:hypothetical protein
LKVTYRHISEAEHGWNYTRQQLDVAHELVDERTHMVIHLEHANEQQDHELEESVAVMPPLSSRFRRFSFKCHPLSLTLCRMSMRSRFWDVSGCGVV